ncbi:hypothetical protein PTSG_03253 [Salpingoeca rosetta]|uniref:Uncharacterized protein n=1 Tax=Salpingoeca rosetta (strain ATCC 50818 / BSB-021) TaxID=946362 RepID=F2U4N3_SALR5|nr:uncharacterized protein PTSG_03253 [Salpingoeca rosetta]EGD82599.1 hypothetical protein PTSG_03253 [Salpingoeca rosetta]|eukprot:XP_004995835.1 hypothetical protein PTSG_03253 [Salpingoeca rosetta]
MEELPTYELEAQFFGFLPTTVIDLVINAVNDYVLLSADSLKTFLLESSSSPFREEPDHVWKAVTAVVNFVQDAVDKYFDKFELYCFRNVFKIPEALPVPGDIPAGQRAPQPSGENSLQTIITDINTELDRHAKLRAELRRLKREAKTNSLRPIENGIKQTWSSHGGNLLQDHIVYLWEQVDGVKAEAQRVFTLLHEQQRLQAKRTAQQGQPKQQQATAVESTPGTLSPKRPKTSRPILPDEVLDSM